MEGQAELAVVGGRDSSKDHLHVFGSEVLERAGSCDDAVRTHDRFQHLCRAVRRSGICWISGTLGGIQPFIPI